MLQHDPALELPERARSVEPSVCPFKGLAAFEAADAIYFCGRERLLSELIARLASGTFVGIVGPSGVGKSSLLRAACCRRSAPGRCPEARAGASCSCARDRRSRRRSRPVSAS